MARRVSGGNTLGAAIARYLIRKYREGKKDKAKRTKAQERADHKAKTEAEKARLKSQRSAEREAHKATKAAEKAKKANHNSWTHEKHMYHHERAMYHADRTTDPERKKKYLSFAAHHLTQARKYE